jgi:hypothetical protein
LETDFLRRSTVPPARCACAIAEAVRPLDIQVRCGLHAGEIEIGGNDVRESPPT